MTIGILTLHIHLPDCHSLKEKRRLIQPVLVHLHKEFNVSAAEMDLLDRWQETIISCAVISNDTVHNQQLLQTVLTFVIHSWRDFDVIDHRIEIF